MPNPLRERPKIASAILSGLIFLSAGLTIWGGFSDQPFFQAAWHRVMGVSVPPPVIGHVLALVMLGAILLLGYIVVAIGVPSLSAKRRRVRRSRRPISIKPMSIPPYPSARSSRDASTAPSLDAMKQLHDDIGDVASEKAVKVLNTILPRADSHRHAREGRMFIGQYIRNGLEGARSRFIEANGAGDMERAQRELGRYYMAHRRCIWWIEEMIELFRQGFEKDSAYVALMDYDRRFTDRIRELAVQPGYERLGQELQRSRHTRSEGDGT